MMFPFSFWGGDPFDGVIQNLEFFENFNTYFDPEWAPVIETLVLNETFTPW